MACKNPMIPGLHLTYSYLHILSTPFFLVSQFTVRVLAVAVLLAFALGVPNEAQFLSVGVFWRLLACPFDQLGRCSSSKTVLFIHFRVLTDSPRFFF